MEEKLLDLQKKIDHYHNTERNGDNLEYAPRISFSKIGNVYELVFYGEGYDDDPTMPLSGFEPETYNYAFCAIQEFLIENPEQIVSLVFTGPDAGANGTRDWNFNRIVNSNVVFPHLKKFKVALTDVADHNQSVIGEYGEENGMIAQLVSKMPNLEELALPSAPSEEFFALPELKIQWLTIQAGYDRQNFIENLTQSKNLPYLKALDYTERYDHFGDLEDEEFTSFESFQKLFESDALSYIHFHLKLRENRLNEDQLKQLQTIRKIQFLHIKTEPGKYIRL